MSDREQFPETEWTDERGEKWTREDFLAKMNWEGGWTGMVCWGGPSVFPPSLRETAQKTYDYEFGDDVPMAAPPVGPQPKGN